MSAIMPHRIRYRLVLQEVKAKYVYGVTATPVRGDGLERINYMLLGPIRYRYTSKEKAKAQGVDHLVYPRFTRKPFRREALRQGRCIQMRRMKSSGIMI